MKLPGNNSITLCSAALCEILQEHIAKSYYTSDASNVRVTAVTFDTISKTARFVITTDGAGKPGSITNLEAA